MAKLYYQGHGSFRITLADGRVMYIDPNAGGGYDLPADFILVTHQHSDHNQIKKCVQKPGCLVLTNEEALAGGTHQRFELDGITVEAVEAGNKMHNPKQCVGYILTVDGVSVYASGDTSKTAQMETFAARGLEYALYCCDGVFNMGLDEATECAALVGAKHNIPIHMKPGFLFSKSKAAKWIAPNKLVVAPGEEIELKA